MIRNLGAVIIDKVRLEFIKSCFDSLEPREKLLDLGCGVKPFHEIYSKKSKTSVGVEVETSLHDQSQVDFFYDGVNLPFDNQEFDIVFSSEVMEHVPDPEKFLSEIHRVLNHNGIAILTVPFFVPLHEQPHDYYRYTEYALRHLVEKSNFSMERLEVFGDYFSVLISLLIIPHLKLWNQLSKKLHLPFIRSIFNPIIFVFIYLPQGLYLALRKLRFFKKIFRKMSYVPKGYGFVIKKKLQ